ARVALSREWQWRLLPSASEGPPSLVQTGVTSPRLPSLGFPAGKDGADGGRFGGALKSLKRGQQGSSAFASCPPTWESVPTDWSVFLRTGAARWRSRTAGASAPSSRWWPRALGLWSPPSSVRPGEVGARPRLEAPGGGAGAGRGPDWGLRLCPSASDAPGRGEGPPAVPAPVGGQWEVPAVLQWCPGAPVLVPERCPLCHLVSGPHPLHWHHVGTVTVVSPLELVRTKLQARHVSYRELGTCVRAAVAQGGWRSLWLGWGPTALRDVPFSALYWFNYELMKSWLNGRRPKDQTPVGISFVAGGISGMVAATLTLPFDVVKTQRQVALGAMEAVRVSPPHTASTWLLLRRIRAESGTRGLFAGFLPRIIKAAPSCAIMISTYEFGKSFFQRLNRDRPLCP
uniref:Mitochondrial glutathione transporter SLC25A39 n=1 Tax=Oryctolagus cuniculus TaxID=9986 RepID=A0A5F9CNE5_RABIT